MGWPGPWGHLLQKAGIIILQSVVRGLLVTHKRVCVTHKASLPSLWFSFGFLVNSIMRQQQKNAFYSTWLQLLLSLLNSESAGRRSWGHACLKALQQDVGYGWWASD